MLARLSAFVAFTALAILFSAHAHAAPPAKGSLVAALHPAAGVQARPPAPPALLPVRAAAARPPAASIEGAFTPLYPEAGVLITRWDARALREVLGLTGAAVIRDFPLTPGRRVDLEVERFWVTSPMVRFVAGGGTGGVDHDQDLAFDPESVILLRGRVAGRPRSHVYIGLSPHGSQGLIEVDGERYGLSSKARGGVTLPADQLSIFRATSVRGPDFSSCTVLHPSKNGGRKDHEDTQPRRGLRQIELAIETDAHFFQLFGDESATAAYIVIMYGAVSDIFMRDINTRVDITYVRLWPSGNVPYVPGLSNFQSHWQNNMQSVHRDVAQMFTGRADMPGGVAWLNSICTNTAYSFCGNAVGYFIDVDTSSVFNYDPQVAAHELGHNFGTHHTDTFGIDICNQLHTPARRGTIMSYCNQTISGAMAVIDVRFHKLPQRDMRNYIAGRACVVFDCNQNGVSDAIDIATSVSLDVNNNGIPDECEDCNNNGILDSIDIATSFSLDLNGNGIPDECEPDCNNNGIPDDLDILSGFSQDRHGDNVPDECDHDHNSNMVSDYNEIMEDMTLDRDRDRLIDSTQDCGTGIPNLVALDGAWDAWAVSGTQDTIRQYHSVTGVHMRTGSSGFLNLAHDLIITPDRRILVASAADHRIVEFNHLGGHVRDLVPAGAPGNLLYPTALAISPAGTLVVASRNRSAVLEYNVETGAYLRDLVATGAGGLSNPYSLLFTPAGTLLVSDSNNRVHEYEGVTGAFIRTLVGAANGGLSNPRGMVFNPLTGNLLVASHSTNQVLEFNNASGAFLRAWLVTGLVVDGPWTMRIGPDGMVYISRYNVTDTHITRARIYIFDPRNGNFVRSYVQARDSGLNNPTGFDFLPGQATDCNRNLLPDACDIASGFSLDRNRNGIPDECETGTICYANCDGSVVEPVLNIDDFACFINQYALAQALPHEQQVVHYANCDNSSTAPALNIDDFTCFINAYALACP
jgi:DNA-binding beta-propeller fold protein YncE